jgi:tetratricopeptide (TPR) repeat protein
MLGAPGAGAPLAESLRRVVDAVQYRGGDAKRAPHLASEWLAESYFEQSRQRLGAALECPRKAAAKSPEFGFAWVRIAELEFGFGRTGEALKALEKGLALSPRNAQALALKGFLLSAQNRTKEAQGWFDRAIAVDGALGNAWLGRGLCRIREGRGDEGRQDLQVAATLEPQRAVLRSYLGKAWSHTDTEKLADKDLALAKKLDPNDPTAWLYSALLNQNRNRINEAIRDFEQSRALNDNRSVFRSGMLLDQDRAVRSANLATAYRDAGMPETGHREASRAVLDDYANFSAHLFLHETYEALRDPKQFNLRYDNARLGEFLIGNLLAPAGASSLSQGISQQEYTRLFDTKRFGVNSATEYSSHGDWTQTGSQFGNFGNFSYALDGAYRSERGYRPNNDLEQRDVTFRAKMNLTQHDSVFLQTTMYEGTSGDIQQYFSQAMASPTLRVTERQEPNVLAGFHHEWSPGMHTLVLAGRLDDTLELREPTANPLFLKYTGGAITFVTVPPLFHFNFERRSEIYVAEAQQIWETPKQTMVAGVAYQNGSFATDSLLDRTLQGVVADQHFRTTTDRVSVYLYETWRPVQTLGLQAGVTYDHLRSPRNLDIVPIVEGTKTTSRVSPKLGFQFSPNEMVKLRGAWTRSLGGAFNENTYRLEPTQVGGFNQAFRSILPESVAGLVPASRFESRNLALDLNLRSGTFLSIEGEFLGSKSARTVGVLTNSTFFPVPDRASATEQRIEFEEKSLFVTANQLLGKEWSIGGRYRLSQANFTGRFGALPPGAVGASMLSLNNSVLLHQLNLGVNYNHRCGFFAQWASVWSMQENSGYTPAQSGADFWQHNIYAGYRFPKRHAELRIGVANLLNRNYQLNPLNLYAELPRERAVTVGLKLNF